MPKNIIPEMLLDSGMAKYMPQGSPLAAQAFVKVQAFAKRMRIVILTVVLMWAVTAIVLLILYEASKVSILRLLLAGSSIVATGYLGFLWLSTYWCARSVHYLLGEHWWWTAWLLLWPLALVSELTDALATPLVVILLAWGYPLRKWRARKMALEIQANPVRWESLASTSLREIALGRFR